MVNRLCQDGKNESDRNGVIILDGLKSIAAYPVLIHHFCILNSFFAVPD